MENKDENDLLAGLTDAERAGMQDPDGGPDPDAELPRVADEELEETPEEKAAREQAEAAAAAAASETPEQKAAREAAAAANNGGDDEDAAAPAPVLVAQAPADAEAELAKITKGKADLAQKFDDGELSAKDYQAELDALNKQERQIELKVHEADLAAKMAAQQARNLFLAEVATFTQETYPLYSQSGSAWTALDVEVRKLAADESSASLTGKQILQKAHENLMKDPVLKAAFEASKPPATKAEGGKPAPAKPAAPTTLGKVPSAEGNDTNGDRFAGLERLLKTDPIAYEREVGKLSEADRDAFLSR